MMGVDTSIYKNAGIGTLSLGTIVSVELVVDSSQLLSPVCLPHDLHAPAAFTFWLF